MQNGRLDWVGGGDQEKQRGCKHLWKKSELLFSPEMENFHWLKSNKSLTTDDRDCLQVCSVVCDSCHH